MSRPLISADDVRRARERRETRLLVPPGAIVTPLARDEAARHGIELAAGEEEAPRSALPERPHVPTCDDPGDPLERIVARVRARVPGADPEQICRIARRVLDRLEPGG